MIGYLADKTRSLATWSKNCAKFIIVGTESTERAKIIGMQVSLKMWDWDKDVF